MPKFLKFLVSVGILLLLLGIVDLWYSTVVIGGLYYNAPIKAGLSTLLMLTLGYGAFESIRFIFKK